MAAVMCAAPAALAHHSFAMFDAGKLVTLEGTVKQFQWTNPHAWIILMVNEQGGQPPAAMGDRDERADWLGARWLASEDSDARHAGEVVIHPLRDGNKGGQYLAITLPDGTLMGNPQGRGNPAQVARRVDDRVPSELHAALPRVFRRGVVQLYVFGRASQSGSVRALPSRSRIVGTKGLQVH
jgi:hypothetical protein